MRLVFGVLALSLLGADGPRGSDAPMLVYQVRILEMNGLDWRASLHPQLQPVARHGAATVWTAPRDAASALAAKAGKVIAAPKLTAQPGSRAAIVTNKTHRVVTEMARRADGPVNHASYVAFSPKVEEAAEGFAVSVTGRKLDQGVLAQVAIDEKQLTALHAVALNESLEPEPGRDPKKRSDKVAVTVQVPEFARTEVAGEWLIPNDGVLLVSLGARTAADPSGKAVVRERLAVIEANPAEAPAAVEAAGLSGHLTKFTRLAPPLIPLPMAAPLVPSRSLPQPLSATGEPVPLPPLPADHTPPTALPNSSEPCATPQTKGSSPAAEPLPLKPSELADPASNRAGFVDEPACCDADGECPASKPSAASGWSPAAPRTFSFRLPINGRMTIEVRASAGASPRP